MSSLTILGDTSGSVVLQAPAVSGSTTITMPAATGTMMVSGNMPLFRAIPASNQTVSHSTTTKVNFGTETYDTNNNFASSRFTPTVAGYYQINATIRFNGTYTSAAFTLFKNGGNVGYLGTTASSSDTIKSGSSLQYMNGSTDYLEIYVNMTGTGLTVGSSNPNTNYFSGSLVRAA